MQTHGDSTERLRSIAEDLGVSVDDLLGVDKAPKQRERNVIIAKIKAAFGRRHSDFDDQQRPSV